MVTRYKDYITENNTVEGITPEELVLLKKYKIKNYSFNEETGFIDVIGNVTFSSRKIKELPNIRFGTITGNFSCSYNRLKSLQNCPLNIGGDFYCNNNQLTDLKYCPTIIGGSFTCSRNELTSLQYCPSEIGGGFSCSNNQLTDLKYCPKIVNGNFYCINNDGIKDIADYPLSIIKGVKITDIFHFPDILNIVKENPERYIPFIENGDKIRFHQQIMRDEPSMIQYYIDTSIPVPKKASFI